MDNLIKVFKYSSDNVIITDYDFNILWFNKEDKFFSACGGNCSAFFINQLLPLKSGEYYIIRRGLLFECRVINYPDCENGVYVILTSGEDVIYSAVKCKGMREIIINQSAALRNAISGISCSGEMLRRVLDNAEMYDEQKYIDITAGNCCKLLNISSDTLELIHYADGNFEKRPMNLSLALEEFILKSSNVLKNKIQFEKKIATDLFIEADPDRFTVFMAAMIKLANSGNAENNIIKISAEQSGDFISVTVVPDSNGTDYAERKFAKHINMYEGDEVNLNLIIAERFCKVFGGTLFISNDEVRSFNVRLPYCSAESIPPILKTSSVRYDEGMFSKYHIIYSELLY